MRFLSLAALPLALTAGLAGCSNPEKVGRYLIDPPTPAQRVANRLGTAELKDVSLPEYASGQEVAWQTEDGAVRSNPDNLWGDSPQRAFTLTLARAISDASGATVIGEPWPLAEPPARKLEVRVEKALAQADGAYRLAGRYFVSDAGYGGTSQARSFDISVPLTDQSPGTIARAQSRAISQLAAQIATLSGPGRAIATRNRSAGSVDAAFAMDPIF